MNEEKEREKRESKRRERNERKAGEGRREKEGGKVKRGMFATHSKFNEDLPSHGDPDNHSAQFEHNKIKLTSG